MVVREMSQPQGTFYIIKVYDIAETSEKPSEKSAGCDVTVLHLRKTGSVGLH